MSIQEARAIHCKLSQANKTTFMSGLEAYGWVSKTWLSGAIHYKWCHSSCHQAVYFSSNLGNESDWALLSNQSHFVAHLLLATEQLELVIEMWSECQQWSVTKKLFHGIVASKELYLHTCAFLWHAQTLTTWAPIRRLKSAGQLGRSGQGVS